ncbi:MAG: lysophospholipid acyltransferase family protein [Desulfobacteraceae bacterium]|nr:lysophospholipid acyltransferase family protein [Desulfobacteraceae bacterium]
MKLSWKNRLKTEAVAFIAVNLMRLWFATVRVEVLNRPVYEKYFKDPETGNAVAGSWHRNVVFLFYFFRKLGPRGIMVSRSRDGELIARAGRYLGYTPVRGSSSKGGLHALSEMIEYLKDGSEKRLCGTAVDGPQGPARKMKKGMAVAAKESGSWFIPVAFSGTRVITFSRAWDKTIIPKPFSKAVVDFGEPVHIPKDASEEEFSRICDDIEKELNRLTDKVDRVCGYDGGQN